jgi:hypothetical protein
MIAGLTIHENPYMPEPQLRRLPAKGPYWRRRYKRAMVAARSDPSKWKEPTLWILGGRILICHPLTGALLRTWIGPHDYPPRVRATQLDA